MVAVTLLLSVTLFNAVSSTKEFPPGFMFGAATSSYQVEGSWNKDGKGESIWDRLVHATPEAVADNSTGDIAADSNMRWKDDIRIASELGLHFYRFSISWPRIFPTGFTNKINKAGVKYYNDLINGLLEAGIDPLVTLYHWDLPVSIQDLGGWTNPLISTWFADYARQVFFLYGDRVKLWITINEPVLICDFGYFDGALAPGIRERQFGPHLCAKNVLMAHAKAYRIYDWEFRKLYGGRVSIANHIMWFEPETPRDKGIADLTMDYAAGRYTHPIFSSKGGWPPSIERFMWIESLKEGYNTSRLPEFTSAEKKFIRGTADFFGLNYYTSRIVRRAKPGENLDETILSLLPYSDTYIGLHPDSYSSAAPMFVMYPKGLRQTLSWIKRTCGNPSILITENGYPTSGLETEDYNRLKALRDHLEQVNLSIYEDGVNVVGYTFWSLLDNFEWLSGYTLRFGLYQIDFQDPELTRVPRLSAKYFACVIQNNCVEIPNDCFNMNPTKRVKRQILSNINKITNLPNISKLPNASNLPKIPKLPSPEKVANSVELMQEVVENRKCIIKVMGMAAKFMRLMNND